MQSHLGPTRGQLFRNALWPPNVANAALELMVLQVLWYYNNNGVCVGGMGVWGVCVGGGVCVSSCEFHHVSRNLYSVSQKEMVRVEMRHFDHYCSMFSTAFYNIFKITKLALKYRLFHQIYFCYSRDMFD